MKRRGFLQYLGNLGAEIPLRHQRGLSLTPLDVSETPILKACPRRIMSTPQQ